VSEQPLAKFDGKCSHFGGPEDQGVSPEEGLAFIYKYDQAPYLFLPQQPPGTTGLARRLNADEVDYVACRWDYAVTPKEMLAKPEPALVFAPSTLRAALAYPADWGPHADTDRVADLSPHLMAHLGIATDGEVVVIYPAPTLPPLPKRKPKKRPKPKAKSKVKAKGKAYAARPKKRH